MKGPKVWRASNFGILSKISNHNPTSPTTISHIKFGQVVTQCLDKSHEMSHKSYFCFISKISYISHTRLEKVAWHVKIYRTWNNYLFHIQLAKVTWSLDNRSRKVWTISHQEYPYVLYAAPPTIESIWHTMLAKVTWSLDNKPCDMSKHIQNLKWFSMSQSWKSDMKFGQQVT